MLFKFELEDGNFSKAGYTSSQIEKVLKQLIIDPRIIKRVVVALYEAEMNIVAHAWRGAVVAELNADKISLELKDEGLEIPNISLAMHGGYSAASEAVREVGSSAGMELPNMKRNVDELMIESQVDVSIAVRTATWFNKGGAWTMGEANFYHALKIDNDRCIGRTHCMEECPTGAVRVRDGKALVHKDRRMDCGKCPKSCPTEAIYAEQDGFQHILGYRCKVALMPTIFIGQFSKYTTGKETINAIMKLGFIHVFQVEFTADMIHKEMVRQMENTEEEPVISSFCPAIVWLIRVRFPALVESILLMKVPVNASATHYYKISERQGVPSGEIDIFYVTSYTAKIVALKGAEGCSSAVKGMINVGTLYSRVYHILKNHPRGYEPECELPPPLTEKETRWGQTGEEAKHFSGRCPATDEIHNAIDSLGRMGTTSEVRNVDFLKLRVCGHSYVGDALAVANRFLTAERIMKRPMSRDRVPMIYAADNFETLLYLRQHIAIRPVQPNPKQLYDGTIGEMLKKMEQVRKLICYLLGIDCGAYDNPNCQNLAEDIVRREARFSDCVFM